MRRVVCAVRDNAIEAFGQPFFVPHVNAATRAFVNDATQDGNPVKANPADFDLYQLGWFDEETGVFDSLPDGRPSVVLRGVAVPGLVKES